MSDRVVCDSSALVALLLDSGSDGQWATGRLRDADLSAPALVAFETANVIRRHELAGLISPDQARQAHADLVDLPIEQWPYEILASRAWALRANLSSHDAGYVALAELLDAPLVTLDRRLARIRGLRCKVLVPGRG